MGTTPEAPAASEAKTEQRDNVFAELSHRMGDISNRLFSTAVESNGVKTASGGEETIVEHRQPGVSTTSITTASIVVPDDNLLGALSHRAEELSNRLRSTFFPQTDPTDVTPIPEEEAVPVGSAEEELVPESVKSADAAAAPDVAGSVPSTEGLTHVADSSIQCPMQTPVPKLVCLQV